MADSSKLFKEFNSTIKLSEPKREILKSVRDELRDRMKDRYYRLLYEDVRGDHRLEFQTQGSFVMDTIITPIDDDFDLDDGVYFAGGLKEDQRPKPQMYHDWVLHAVGEDENYGEVTDKDTCVRVRYKNEGFHIDLPIYYADNLDSPDLAHKKKGWILSNPVEFIAWFEEKVESGFQKAFLYEREKMFSEYTKWSSDIRKKDAQLRRIVRYLKAWGDHLRGEMPPGIVMTILAANNYSPDLRDDIALRDTLINIAEYLKNNGFKCPRPTTPIGEDLFLDYPQERKDYFKDELDKFIDSAKSAISISNPKDACYKWKKHLGGRFPCYLANDEEEGAKTFATAGAIRSNANSAQ